MRSLEPKSAHDVRRREEEWPEHCINFDLKIEKAKVKCFRKEPSYKAAISVTVLDQSLLTHHEIYNNTISQKVRQTELGFINH